MALAVLSTTSPYITINNGNIALGQIAASGSANAVFSITCSPSTPVGRSVDLVTNVACRKLWFHQYSTYFCRSYSGRLGTWQFYPLPLEFSGNANWAVVTANQYEGAYTAISGAIEHSQTSEMSVTLQVNAAGTVSFYRKTFPKRVMIFCGFISMVHNKVSGQEKWPGAR